MSLDELSLDSGEVGWDAREAPSEKSEKQKESSRRAQAQLQKTQKDEKKAKWDNDDLFLLLSRFIQNPLYEELIPSVVSLLQMWYPSRFILVIIALVYPEAAHYLMSKIGKILTETSYMHMHRYDSAYAFHNEHLHPSIRDWVTLWMTGAQDFLSHPESSVVLHQKTLSLLSSSSRITAEDGVKMFFVFFLAARNVSIQSTVAQSYAQYIVAEYEKVIQKYLDNADPDLRMQSSVDVKSLFGMG